MDAPGPPSPPDTVTVDEVTDNTAQLTWSPAQEHGSTVSIYLVQTRNPYSVGWQRASTGGLRTRPRQLVTSHN